MNVLKTEIYNALLAFDTSTLFNAMVKVDGKPNFDYMSHEIRCLLPELGGILGYAVTAEVTTNDPDSPACSWAEHYANVDRVPGPVIAVLKDVDSRPGRGASFGEGMTLMHKRLGGVGVIVDGTVRDVDGMQREKFPAFARGSVPGHGRFKATRLNTPITVGDLRIRPGDLLMADATGCLRLPIEKAKDVIAAAHEVMDREQKLFAQFRSPDTTLARLRKLMNWED